VTGAQDNIFTHICDETQTYLHSHFYEGMAISVCQSQSVLAHRVCTSGSSQYL